MQRTRRNPVAIYQRCIKDYSPTPDRSPELFNERAFFDSSVKDNPSNTAAFNSAATDYTTAAKLKNVLVGV